MKFLLTYRIADTDAIPNVMLAALGALIALGCCLEGMMR